MSLKTSPQDCAQQEMMPKKVYDWDEFKPSVLCGPFNFVLQLVLVGCCGSFLFGYNVANLNTAFDVMASEFQICGRLHPYGEYLYEVARTKGNSVAWILVPPISEVAIESGCKRVDPRDPESGVRCPGGPTDFDCPKFMWLEGFLKSAIMISGCIGALVAGKLVSFGRRLLLIIVACIFCLGIVNSLFAGSYAAMLWARLLVGLGIGLVSVGAPTYISEMTPPELRGKYGVLHQLSITIGIFIAITLGLPLSDPRAAAFHWTPDTFSMFWWRFMLGLGLLPTALNLYFLAFVYTFDTPVYYTEQYRYEDSQRLFRKIFQKDDVAKEFKTCVDNVRTGEDSRQRGLGLLSAMKNAELRHVILVGIALSCFQQIGGINVFMTSSATIFAKAGLSKSMQVGMSIVMALINVLMTFPTIVLIEKMGRRTALLWGSLLQTLCVIPSAIANWTEANPENPSTITQVLAIIAIIGFVLFFAVAFGPIVWVYLFEIYPMDIKDVASSVATSFNWISAIIIVFVSNVLENKYSFVLFSVIQGIATAFIFFFIKETKGIPLGNSPYVTQGNLETKRYAV